MIIKIEAYLRQKSKDMELDENARIELYNKLIKEATAPNISAAGLSAIQIAVPKRMFIMKNFNNGEWDVYVNPKIINRSVDMINFYEGCLSFPNKTVLTDRHMEIEIIDEIHGKQTLSGVQAVVAQHEENHLNGILMFDRRTKIKDKSKLKIIGFEDEREEI